MASVPGASRSRRLAPPPGRPGNSLRGRGDLPEEAAQGMVGARPRTLLGGDSGQGPPCPHRAQSQGSQTRREATCSQENDLPRRTEKDWRGEGSTEFVQLHGACRPARFLSNNKIPPSVNAQVSSLLLPSKAQPIKLTHRGQAECGACLPFPWRPASFARSPVSLSSGSQRSSGVQLSGNTVRGCVLAK